MQGQFLPDLALVRMERAAYQRLAECPTFFFGWANSSPHVGCDWLVARYSTVPKSDVDECRSAQLELALNRPLKEAAVRNALAARKLQQTHGFHPHTYDSDYGHDRDVEDDDDGDGTTNSSDDGCRLDSGRDLTQPPADDAKRQEFGKILKDKFVPTCPPCKPLN